MRETLRGLLDLTRPVNAVAAGALTLIGAYVAGVEFGGLTQYPMQAAAAALATALAVGAGNAINDYFDRDIDAINQPDRAIPRGAVSARGALVFSGVLFLAAVVLALTLPVLAIAIAGFNLVALVVYTEWLKGLPGVGNLVVAYLGGSTFLFGGVAVDTGRTGLLTVGVLAALAALSTFTREVIKDVEDLSGDEEEGLNTLPIAIGARPALVVATVALLVAVVASPLPYVRDEFGLAYLVVLVPADLVMLGAAGESFDDPTAAQEHLKYGQFLAALSFLVGRIAPVGL